MTTPAAASNATVKANGKTIEESAEAGAPKASAARAPQSAGGRASRPFIMAALLALLGLADAVYLTVNHLTGQSVRCTITTGCDEVLGSPYAVIAGIPLAAIGAASYFFVFSLAVLVLFGYARARLPLRLLVALMLFVTLWLLYLQAFVIGHFCQYCLLSAAVTLSLAATLLAEFFISHSGNSS
ncbi:MAG TPA: vitamin K epoxide reductase family protein [Pyrinomonadaceae bacterium]|jgi:uncharacterized membrane protein